jgi:pimeloyl-ACP methyl ester carboxylesterase
VAETMGLLKVSDQSVVLCGYSYGGMVITGAADAVPEKVRALVYLDAYLRPTGTPLVADDSAFQGIVFGPE